MPLHVLLIEGMSIAGTNFYADQLLASSPHLRAPTCIVTRVSFDYGRSFEDVQEAMRRHDYNAIIVCDLSNEQNMFAVTLGPIIQRYVRSGGRVAFPTTEGLNLIPVLRELFDVPWTRSSYGRGEWIPNPQSAALLSKQFPLRNGERAVNMQFYLKGCSYKNVPQSDRCFEAKQYDHEDDSDEEYVTPAEREEPHVLVAVRSYGDGFVSYFGDVNCELPTAKLISAFVTVPRKRPPCSWDAERNVTRAMQAKENGNKAFREGNFRHALSFYNEAKKHLDPVANRRKQECSKVLGNIAECHLKLNQWSDAIEASTKALELDPSNVKGHYRRARAHLMAARNDINALKRHGNVQASAISHLHDLTVKLSEYTLLESETRTEANGSSSGNRSIGLLSKSSGELRELGNEKFKMKMYDFAISYYEAALVVGPSDDGDHVKILCNLSLCHNRKEDWPLAVKTANDALEINPNSEKALLRRAQAYVRMDKAKDAKADLKRLESLPGVPKKELRALADELKNVSDETDEQQASEPTPHHFTTQIPGAPPINLSMQSIDHYNMDRPQNAWSNGLGRRERYEWLADCYRMRVDDEYSYMGDVRAGSMYDPDHSADSMMLDFLIFCKLAVARNALPPEWDWSQFLNIALNNLGYAFGKADAQEKYGVENFFNGFLESGRSLRFTAKEIYISDFTKPDENNEVYNNMSEAVMSQFYEESDVVDFRNAGTIFADVGGTGVWQRFWRQIAQRLRA